MDEQVTAFSDATQRTIALETPGTARRRRQSFDKLRAFALGVGFPALLVLLWHVAVAYTGTRLVPSPRQVAVMMYDFSFGGVYDDTGLNGCLQHRWVETRRGMRLRTVNVCAY